jgi:hypothetical protein
MSTKVGYYHVRLDNNEIFYVGIGDIHRPYSYDSRNPHWYHVVQKVGYKVIIVESDIDWETACKWEKSEIKRIGRRDLGLGTLVNMTDGGEGTQGIVITEERRKKVSEATKIAMNNPEVIQKLKDAKIDYVPWNKGISMFFGEDNPNYGNKWSNEQKEQLSEKLKDVYQNGFSEDHINKLKEGRKGKKPALGMKHTEETKRMMSKNRKGKKQSQHQKDKVSIALRGKEQKKRVCPHCGKVGGNTMSRWHFDNCYSK